ncbi:MAG: MopE-related protein [archaeon]
MNKRVVIIIFICFLLIGTSTVYAFSLQNVFNPINNFFDWIFGRNKVVGIFPNCTCNYPTNAGCTGQKICQVGQCQPGVGNEGNNGHCVDGFSLTVTKSGVGTGTVTSSPSGINCGSDCNQVYAFNSAVTLTAAANEGSTFVGWSGACTGTGACYVTMSSAKTVNAIFVQQVCDCDSDENCNSNQYCDLTANCYSGESEPGFTGNIVLGYAGLCKPKYSLTVTKTGTGTVTSTNNQGQPNINCGTDCSKLYKDGTIISLIPNPTSVTWSGACTGTGTCQFTMDSDKNVGAAFSSSSIPYTLTVTKTGTGTVTSSPGGINCGSDCSEAYNSGTSVSLTPTPNSVTWSGACTGTGACSVTMSSAKTVNANFNQIPSGGLTGFITRFYIDDVSVVAVNNPSVNKVLNPGIESGLTNWDKYPNALSVYSLTVNTDTQYSKSGKSLNVSTNISYTGITQKTLSLQPNTLYKYSADVYVINGRVAMTFWGDDRASQVSWVTPYNGQGWYHLENYLLTHSGQGGGANNPNNEITIYSWLNTNFEICDDNIDNDQDTLTDCSDITDCNNAIHYENSVSKWQCISSGGKKETNFTDGIDNDNDGVLDKFDADCTGTCNALNVSSIQFPSSLITFYQHFYINYLNCYYGKTLNEADVSSILTCVNLNVSNAPCLTEQYYSNYIKFSSCYVGGLGVYGTSNVRCYIDPKCKQGNPNLKDSAITVTEFPICNYNSASNKGDKGEGNFSISIAESELQGPYETGDTVEMEIEVVNQQTNGQDMDIKTEAWLVDTNVNTNSVKLEIVSDPEEIEFGQSGIFSLDLELPYNLTSNHTYRIYYKAYKQNYENQMCSSSNFALNFEGGDCSDNDNDGYNNDGCGGTDCNDNNVSINPGAIEVCTDLIDNNCNGLTDFADSYSCNGTGIGPGPVTPPATCIENWDCSPFVPSDEDCNNNEQQTRTCVDINNCQTSLTKPIESKLCGGTLDMDIDVDGDGLPDEWEYIYFGNLNQGPNDDPDGDGMTNAQEYASNTNPKTSDKLGKGGGLGTILIVTFIIVVIAIIVILVYFKVIKKKQGMKKQQVQNIQDTTSAVNYDQLINYINQCKQKGLSNEIIRNELLKAGWKKEDIDKYLK